MELIERAYVDWVLETTAGKRSGWLERSLLLLPEPARAPSRWVLGVALWLLIILLPLILYRLFMPRVQSP